VNGHGLADAPTPRRRLIIPSDKFQADAARLREQHDAEYLRWEEQMHEIIRLLMENAELAGFQTGIAGVWATTTGYVGIVRQYEIIPITVFYSFNDAEVNLEAVIQGERTW